jgi:predicted MFS family arabinose efflux permease
MTSTKHPTLAGALAVRVFACFALAYSLSFALRAVNAVIAPDLVREFGLSNSQLGSLSAAYFFAFASLQLPLGIWLDRFGSRRTDATLLLLAAAGCGVFASASDVTMLWIGRALIGAGVCGALMSALKGYRFWYPPKRQQQLAAWMLVAGTTGALSSTVPVQAALPLLGWRGVFWVAAALLLLSSAAIWVLVPRDEERQARPQGSGQGSVWAGYLQVFREPEFWRIGLVAIVVQGGFVSMQSLWAGPWLTQVLQMSPQEAAERLFVFNFVAMLGFLALGWAAPRFQERGWTTERVITVASVLVLSIQLAIAFAHGPWAWTLWLALAFAQTAFTLVQTYVSLRFPPELTGRAFTAFNLLTFSGIFVWQWAFGAGVDAFRATGDATPDAFRRTMLVWIGVQALPFLLLVGWRRRG